MTSRPSNNQIVFLLLFLLVLYLFFMMMRPFLVSVVLSVTLVTLFSPNYRELNLRLGDRRGLAAGFMCAIVLFLIIIPVLLLSVMLANEANGAYIEFRASQETLAEYNLLTDQPVVRAVWERIGNYLDLDELNLVQVISGAVERIAALLLSNYFAIIGGVGSFFLNFAVMLFCMFFFFRDGHLILREVKKLIPLQAGYQNLVIDKLRSVIFATFFGIFLTAICQGIVAGLIFFFLGIHNPILWGGATGVLSLVPLVGTASVWVPMSIYLFLTGSIARGVLLLILGASVIGTVDNFVRPLIIRGRSKGMHVLLVFFSLLGGLLLFGPPGLILGPLVSALMMAFLEIYRMEFKGGANRFLSSGLRGDQDQSQSQSQLALENDPAHPVPVPANNSAPELDG